MHANTVRSWTDRGLLTCLRINERGDRRYVRDDVERFIARAGAADVGNAPTAPTAPASGRTMTLIERAGELIAASDDPEALVRDIAELLCREGGYRAATYLAADGTRVHLVGRVRADRRLLSRHGIGSQPTIGRSRGTAGRYRVALPVGRGDRRRGVLVLEGTADSKRVDERWLVTSIAAQLELSLHVADRLARAAETRRRAELLVSVTADIGAELDPTHVLGQLVDHAAELFGADHAAVLGRTAAGSFRIQVARNLSAEYCQLVEHASSLPLTALAFESGQVVTAADYPDDPRAVETRSGLLREGINTATVAPLVSNGEPLGALAVYHDRRHEWSSDELERFEWIAHQGATVMRNAQNYSQMATWAAQLQSIQQLGARLTRLRTVSEIGQTICTELNQLINSHNIRVYRIVEDDCIPVAWRGEIGEYADEQDEQLRIMVGQGITGWVARHGLAQNLADAARDPRTETIPGTADGLDESLLLAPMLFEDEVVGVIVLAKLGLNQFSADDLRLLEIYASIAAQAMANADATERLREQSERLSRQVDSQRELLRVTESILGTLDTRILLAEIAASLERLIDVDNLEIEVYDEQTGLLRPIFARGTPAGNYRGPVLSDERRIGRVAIRTGEALLVQNALLDSRVAQLPTTPPRAGALIVAPLRSGERVQGLLSINRLGHEAHFGEEEFELVKLFAAHVSIALRNAAAHRAVEIRAETDGLTGLGNHGALVEQVERFVGHGTRFTMLMVDLDFFKRYNDHFGHQAANVALQLVGRMLRGACRDSDFVFRYGGDEFAVVLHNTGAAGGRTVANKIKAALAGLNGDGAPVRLTCSIGIAGFPSDGSDGPSVILAADRACYAAKRAGRDRFATAAEGLALAGEFEPTLPTPAAERAYSLA